MTGLRETNEWFARIDDWLEANGYSDVDDWAEDSGYFHDGDTDVWYDEDGSPVDVYDHLVWIVEEDTAMAEFIRQEETQ